MSIIKYVSLGTNNDETMHICKVIVVCVVMYCMCSVYDQFVFHS